MVTNNESFNDLPVPEPEPEGLLQSKEVRDDRGRGVVCVMFPKNCENPDTLWIEADEDSFIDVYERC